MNVEVGVGYQSMETWRKKIKKNQRWRINLSQNHRRLQNKNVTWDPKNAKGTALQKR